MSSEIWNIGHYNHDEMGTTSIRIGWCTANDVFNIDKLTNICSEMIGDFRSVEQDQNEYYIELDSIESEYYALQDDIDAQINELLNRAKALTRKEQNGTITDEERAELKDVTNQLGELYIQSDKQLKDANSKKNTVIGNLQEQLGTKESLAKEYGDAAVDEGSKLANVNTDEGNWIEKQVKKVMKEKGNIANTTGSKLLSLLGGSSTVNSKLITNK